ncbi:HNH endonuclease [Asaia astilbis]
MTFVTERGGCVLTATSVWEVARFTGPGGVCIIYRNANGDLKWNQRAADSWEAWKAGRAWRATPRTKRGPRKRRIKYENLTARDGHDCFYCGKPVSFEEFSIEHLVSLTHGGPDNLTNMAVTHRGCNATAGHLSVVEKVRLAEQTKGLAQ